MSRGPVPRPAVSSACGVALNLGGAQEAGTFHGCFLMLSGIGSCQEMVQDCERVNGLRPIRSPLIQSVGSAGTSKRTSRQITRMALGRCNLGAEPEPEGARLRLSQSSSRLTAQGLRPLQFCGLRETQLVITICFQPCRVSVHKSAPSDSERSHGHFPHHMETEIACLPCRTGLRLRTGPSTLGHLFMASKTTSILL